MVRTKAVSVACGLALLITLGAAGAASATPSAQVSGTWEWTSVFTDTREVGGNLLFAGYEDSCGGGWSGGLDGTSHDTFRGVFTRSGVATALITANFTGSVLGSSSGTMVMAITVLIAPDGTEGGSWVIKGGTAGLLGLHGHGTWSFAEEDDCSMATYEGMVH